MKKQIALLATIMAASGFTAFGQDWMTIAALPATQIWSDTPVYTGGTSLEAAAGQFDIVYLWAATSTADQLSAVGQTAYMGASLSTPSHQVATNAVASVTWAQSIGSLSNMLSGSSWSIVDNINSGSGTATLGEAYAATTGARGAVAAYNGSDSFSVNGVTVGSGSTIELLAIAVNSSAIVSGSLDYAEITAIGWANPINETVGTSSGDPNAAPGEAAVGGINQFGVAEVSAVPEPTTLALAGLGGLSMLFLRRRKA